MTGTQKRAKHRERQQVTALEKALNEWLDADEQLLRGDARVMSTKEWQDRGEDYGKGSKLVMVIDGSPLYEALNYGFPDWSYHTELNELCKEHGFWFEPMYGWALAFYPLD